MNGMKEQLHLSKGESFGSGEFAVEMIEGPPLVRFTVKG